MISRSSSDGGSDVDGSDVVSANEWLRDSLIDDDDSTSSRHRLGIRGHFRMFW